MSDKAPEPSRPVISPTRRIGIGLAVVALPVAAAVTVWELKQNEDKNNDDRERGFRYDDAALRQIDPSLIGYREEAQIQTQMSKPTCFTVGPDGRIYIGGDRLAKVLDSKGRELLSFQLAAEATSIAAAKDGTIYVGLGSHVDVYSPDGKPKASWASVGAGSYISSIAVSDRGVYVADSGLRVGRVLAFDLEGNRTGELAREHAKAGIPGIITPSQHMDVAIAADGNVWVANPGRHQLELYSPAGELLRSFGQSGTAIEQFIGCCNPSDFALLSDGRIITAEKGVPRVKVFSDDGHLTSVVAGPDSFGGNRAGLDIAADAQGHVLVLEPGINAIRVFSEKRP
jgi:hypothetical protein